MKWVVTAISRLTGERVVISSPKEKEVAMLMMQRQKRKNHGRSAWSRLELKPWPFEEERLPFTPPN